MALNKSIDNILGAYYCEEHSNFHNELTEGITKDEYVKLLKNHNLYDLLVMETRGVESEVQELIDNMWEEWKDE